jgi:hypothetical protein
MDLTVLGEGMSEVIDSGNGGGLPEGCCSTIRVRICAWAWVSVGGFGSCETEVSVGAGVKW